MRLNALLFAAGLVVATAGTAAASPEGTPADCAGKSFIAETICKAMHQTQEKQAADSVDVFAYVRALMRPHSALEWFRDRLDQVAAKDTMISSSVRPSTRPAATAPSDAVKRKDGEPAGTRSP